MPYRHLGVAMIGVAIDIYIISDTVLLLTFNTVYTAIAIAILQCGSNSSHP
jgi:hypothetical protein